MFLSTLEMSIRNIRGNRMRSFLTMLGIIIGVGAVISLITIVGMATDEMLGRFSSLGAGSITITTYGTPVKRGLSEQDLVDISQVENVGYLSPRVSVNGRVTSQGSVFKKVSITGRNEQYFYRTGTIRDGRTLTVADMNGSIHVCVLDEKAEKTIFSGRNGCGQKIMINGVQYKIVGILQSERTLSDDFSDSGDSEGEVMIPYRNALRLNNSNTVHTLDVYTIDASRASDTLWEVNHVLRAAFNGNEDAYYIMDMGSLLDAVKEMNSLTSALLGGIASIALLVGGIGIMNMMLVSVTERTKEIGLRKALGADPLVIQIQFLLESVILSVLGGLFGTLFGLGISFIASIVLGTPFRINMGAILIGVLFSVTVGVVFGWAPARKASRLNPIDALRSE